MTALDAVFAAAAALAALRNAVQQAISFVFSASAAVPVVDGLVDGSAVGIPGFHVPVVVVVVVGAASASLPSPLVVSSSSAFFGFFFFLGLSLSSSSLAAGAGSGADGFEQATAKTGDASASVRRAWASFRMATM
jgi:hypothetical protein